MPRRVDDQLNATTEPTRHDDEPTTTTTTTTTTTNYDDDDDDITATTARRTTTTPRRRRRRVLPAHCVAITSVASRAASSAAIRRSRRSARRSQRVLRATSPTAPTKTIVPMTWTCGGRLFLMLAQTQIGKVVAVPDVKFVMMKSSIDRREREQGAGQDPREDQREGHLPEGRPRVRPEVHRGLLEVARKALHPGPNRHDDEADVEHDVGDEDGLDAEREQHPPVSDFSGSGAVPTNSVSRLAPRTISGVAIGMKMKRLVAGLTAEVVAGQRQGDERPQRRRDERRNRRDREAGSDGGLQAGATEGVLPGGQRELSPHEVEAAGRVVEGERDHHQDRQER